MNEMTTTIPSQYVTLNGITYLLTPVKRLEQATIVEGFNDYLDKLDPEIFNRANEVFGKNFDLNRFSTLFTSEYLREDEIEELENDIILYKEVVEEVTYEKILELSLYSEDSFGKMLERAMLSVEHCLKYAEENNLTDSQEYLDWEDDLNAVSVKDHNVKWDL